MDACLNPTFLFLNTLINNNPNETTIHFTICYAAPQLLSEKHAGTFVAQQYYMRNAENPDAEESTIDLYDKNQINNNSAKFLSFSNDSIQLITLSGVFSTTPTPIDFNPITFLGNYQLSDLIL